MHLSPMQPCIHEGPKVLESHVPEFEYWQNQPSAATFLNLPGPQFPNLQKVGHNVCLTGSFSDDGDDAWEEPGT